MVEVKLLRTHQDEPAGDVDALPAVTALRSLKASSAAAASFIVMCGPHVNLEQYSMALVMEFAMGSVHCEIVRAGGEVHVFGGIGGRCPGQS